MLSAPAADLAKIFLRILNLGAEMAWVFLDTPSGMDD